jgi:hypothetical protein
MRGRVDATKVVARASAYRHLRVSRGQPAPVCLILSLLLLKPAEGAPFVTPV